MATAELTRPAQGFTIRPINYELTLAEIEQAAADAKALTVKGLDDKAGIELCHKTRMELRKMRTTIEAKRKTMKADALEYGKQVDSAAKALIAPIEDAEAHLLEQESIVKREQERLAREAEEKRQAMIRERLLKLQECGAAYLESEIAGLPQGEFDALLAAERADKERRDAEAARLKAEQERIAAEQKAEAERLAKEREELERQRVEAEIRSKRGIARLEMLSRTGYAHPFTVEELADMVPALWDELISRARREKDERDQAAAAEQARLDQQRKEQAEAQAKIDAENRRIELEKAKAEAAEKARLQAIEDQKRAEAEAKAAAEREAVERARIEAAKPDHDKIIAVIAALQAIEFPPLSDKTANGEVNDILNCASEELFEVADRLIKPATS